MTKMRAGLFKPNCAGGMPFTANYANQIPQPVFPALIDFMIGHGYMTPDNEPDFVEIITRLHGRFDYERW